MPRARHGSEAADVDRGQLGYPSLKDGALVMHLHELGQPVAEDPVPGKTRRQRLTAGGIRVVPSAAAVSAASF
jgi:hypothetical protein